MIDTKLQQINLNPNFRSRCNKNDIKFYDSTVIFKGKPHDTIGQNRSHDIRSQGKHQRTQQGKYQRTQQGKYQRTQQGKYSSHSKKQISCFILD